MRRDVDSVEIAAADREEPRINLKADGELGNICCGGLVGACLPSSDGTGGAADAMRELALPHPC